MQSQDLKQKDPEWMGNGRTLILNGDESQEADGPVIL